MLDKADALLFAVVARDGDTRAPAEVYLMFENPTAADQVAASLGIDDYTVCPVTFHLDRSDESLL